MAGNMFYKVSGVCGWTVLGASSMKEPTPWIGPCARMLVPTKRHQQRLPQTSRRSPSKNHNRECTQVVLYAQVPRHAAQTAAGGKPYPCAHQHQQHAAHHVVYAGIMLCIRGMWYMQVPDCVCGHVDVRAPCGVSRSVLPMRLRPPAACWAPCCVCGPASGTRSLCPAQVHAQSTQETISA
jgi:hypothetical protein